MKNLLSTIVLIVMTSSIAFAAEEKKGTAEKMGETIGPYIAGGVAGGAVTLLPVTGKVATIITGVATGSAGVNVVGKVGKAAGGGYGKIVDKTGNNRLMPSPIKGHKPSGGGGCTDKSMASCMIDVVKKAVKGKVEKP